MEYLYNFKQIYPYIYDEADCANFMARTSYKLEIRQKMLNIMAMFYLSSNHNEAKTRKKLINFLKKHTCFSVEDFANIEQNWGYNIDKAISYARNHSLLLNKPITFTSKELDKIIKKHSFKKQDILLTICAFAKHDSIFRETQIGENKWICRAKKEVIKNVLPYDSIGKELNELIDKGTIKQGLYGLEIEWLEEMYGDNVELEMMCSQKMYDIFLNIKRER